VQKSKGVVCIITSAFFFALMNVFVRLSGDLPTVQKSFFRNFVAFFFALVILMRSKEEYSIGKGNLKYLILRSLFGTMGILGNFYAVDHLVLADASILNKLSPFFAILFSLLILKEKIKPYQTVCVILAFVGCIFVVKPGFQDVSIVPALAGTIGGMCAGIAYTYVRVLGTRGVKGPLIVVFFSAFSCVVTLPMLIVGFVPMSFYQLGMLLLAGLSAAGGQFSITAAYSCAPAREISIYDYTQIIFSTILGFAFFAQVPDGYSILGYVIICGASVIMFLLNRKAS
jgi:drug/metabolite transporter (DMT)-like permease